MSTKGRYGLRAMVDLVVYGGGDRVSLNQIAVRQEISVNYLEQVFSTLRKAGLVVSIKGAQGGYALRDKPCDIKVESILRCLEGELDITDEEPVSTSYVKNDILQCIETLVWKEMNEAIRRVVDNVTLDDLAKEVQKLLAQEEPMYYI